MSKSGGNARTPVSKSSRTVPEWQMAYRMFIIAIFAVAVFAIIQLQVVLHTWGINDARYVDAVALPGSATADEVLVLQAQRPFRRSGVRLLPVLRGSDERDTPVQVNRVTEPVSAQADPGGTA